MCAAEKLESPISEEFLNSFFDATQKVFQTQGNVKVQLVETTPFPMGMPNSSPTAIAGVIQISCNTFNGSLALGFPKETFLKFYENLLGEACTEISVEMQDAASEFLNMIYGTAKTHLNQKGHNLALAIPTVFQGANLQIRFQKDKPSIFAEYKSDIGPFYLFFSGE